MQHIRMPSAHYLTECRETTSHVGGSTPAPLLAASGDHTRIHTRDQPTVPGNAPRDARPNRAGKRTPRRTGFNMHK